MKNPRNPKTKDLDNCMKVILEHCHECYKTWKDDSFRAFSNYIYNYNALCLLERNNYIKLYREEIDDFRGVELLEKGVYYFATKKQEKRKAILDSVIVPIIVSAITTLITIGLTKLFKSNDVHTTMSLSNLLKYLLLLI